MASLRYVTVMVAMMAWSGCGLSLDLDPRPMAIDASIDPMREDAGLVGAMDAAHATDGAIARDAAPLDANLTGFDGMVPPPRDASSPGFDSSVPPPRDASVARDAGSFGGPDAGSGGCVEGSCAAGEACLFPDGACGGVGMCVALIDPAGCGAVSDPVCGCDGATYTNYCWAESMGVSLAYGSACSGPGGACGVTPPTTFASCCYEDSDCYHPVFGGRRCLSAGMCGGRAGTCVSPAAAGGCFDDIDCGGFTCTGAFASCACGSTCTLTPGRCAG